MNIFKKINELKKRKNALVLAHYYQTAEVRAAADMVGDSYALAVGAARTERDIIVVCGVRFMAESVKLLNPSRKVLLPAPDAGCPMADCITAEDIRALRSENPDAAVVCYVNSTAAVKAESDVCCTSSNAEKIVRSLAEDTVIFVPDKNLGAFVASRVPEKSFVFIDGGCPVHSGLNAADVASAKAANPGALLAVHPECPPEISDAADFCGSTAQIITFAERNPGSDMIIGTETAIVEILCERFPQNRYTPLSPKLRCADMKKTTAKSLLAALENESGEIILTPEEISSACVPLRRMISV